MDYASCQDLYGKIPRYVQMVFSRDYLLAPLKLGDPEKAGPYNLRKGHGITLDKDPFVHAVFDDLVLQPDDPGTGFIEPFAQLFREITGYLALVKIQGCVKGNRVFFIEYTERVPQFLESVSP